MSVRDKLRAAGILQKLERNHNRRVVAAAELSSARAELERLLRDHHGKAPATKMCQAAGIGRSTYYEIVNGISRSPEVARVGLGNRDGGTK